MQLTRQHRATTFHPLYKGRPPRHCPHSKPRGYCQGHQGIPTVLENVQVHGSGREKYAYRTQHHKSKHSPRQLTNGHTWQSLSLAPISTIDMQSSYKSRYFVHHSLKKPLLIRPRTPHNRHVVRLSSNSTFTRQIAFIKVSKSTPHVSYTHLLFIKCVILEHYRNVWHFSRERGCKRFLTVQ